MQPPAQAHPDAATLADEATQTRRLTLPERMDPAAADELAEALEHLRGIPLQLDAGAVRHPSGLFLQLLAIARHQWQSDGVPFRLADASPQLLEAISLLDLSRHFQTEEPLACR